MDKICFTTLEIEINRQCNFSCEHCFCGDSEGFFDFNYDKLGTLLEQTKAVSFLQFTGGEPTLSLETMNNVLSVFEQKNIPICTFNMPTNGSCDIGKFKNFIISLNRHMSRFLLKPINARERIIIQISNDYYHNKFIDCRGVYEKLQKAVGEYCTLLLNDRGSITEKMGRAENLDYLKDSEKCVFTELKECKIQYLKQCDNNSIKCRNYFKYNFSYNGQIIIPCKVVFGNDGRLYNGFRGFMPYKDKDKMNGIEITDNLLKSIDAYNQTVPMCKEITKDRNDNDLIVGYLHHNKEMFIKDMKENGYEVESLFSDNDRKVLDDVLVCLHKCVEGYKTYTEDRTALLQKISNLEQQNKLMMEYIKKAKI